MPPWCYGCDSRTRWRVPMRERGRWRGLLPCPLAQNTPALVCAGARVCVWLKSPPALCSSLTFPPLIGDVPLFDRPQVGVIANSLPSLRENRPIFFQSVRAPVGIFYLTLLLSASWLSSRSWAICLIVRHRPGAATHRAAMRGRLSH